MNAPRKSAQNLGVFLFLLGACLIYKTTSTVLAQEDTDPIVPSRELFLTAAKHQIDAKINSINARIETSRKTLRTLSHAKLEAKEKKQKSKSLQQTLRELRREIAVLKRNKPPYMPVIHAFHVAKGNVGKFITRSPGAYGSSFFEVEHVVDDDEMLVHARHIIARAQVVSRGVVSGGEVTSDRDGPSIWIKGVPTEGRIDGQRTTISGLFIITGTKQYNTTAGGRTVFLAELFDASLLKKGDLPPGI